MKDRRWWRLGWGGLLLLVALAAVLLTGALHVRSGDETLRRISTNSMDVHADFDSFWRSAEAGLEERDIYLTGARLVNLNPPFWTLVVLPFGLMEPLHAYRLFVLITLCITVGAVAWMAGELRLRAGWAVVAAGAVLVSSPFLATLALGQMYPILTLGLVAAWVLDRRGQNVPSGLVLGLMMALKPSLGLLMLWPAVRKKWDAVGATIASGAGATLLATLAFGPQATYRYAEVVLETDVDGFWDNASIVGTVTRMFTETRYAEPLAVLPWLVPASYGLGLALIILTAIKARDGSELGLWALVAASLLASPIAWNNYLLLLVPGVLILLARGRVALALLLLSLQLIPLQWPSLWNDSDTILATLALGLYTYGLGVHWLSFLTGGKGSRRDPRTTTTPVKENVPEPG
ncbi:MAG: glycosyltransferase family 87 protein [Rubrobacteraceae bacterium]